MAYTPDRGDFVWITMTPHAGHEQAGRRPALVLSPQAYNDKVGLALFCPITSQVKGYPFEVQIPSGSYVSGVILSDQIRSLDWRARQAEFIGQASETILLEVMQKLTTLLPSGIADKLSNK
jgi:mRNA interferase MazF